MLKSGNGDVKKCTENLVSIIRGEVAMERVQGIDARLIDKPSDTAKLEMKDDARWNIETYEPRVGIEKVNVTVGDAVNGVHNIGIEIMNAPISETDE